MNNIELSIRKDIFKEMYQAIKKDSNNLEIDTIKLAQRYSFELHEALHIIIETMNELKFTDIFHELDIEINSESELGIINVYFKGGYLWKFVTRIDKIKDGDKLEYFAEHIERTLILGKLTDYENLNIWEDL